MPPLSDERRPPVVLVHGLFGSARWWSRNIGPLSRSFDVHAAELEGFAGRSRRGWFDAERAVPLLIDWMDDMDIQKAHIVGHSLGGLIAARLAADHPDRVDRLVLVDAAMLWFDPGLGRRISGLARAIRTTRLDFAPVFSWDAIRAHPLSFPSAARSLLWSDWNWVLERIYAPTLVVHGSRDTITPRIVAEKITHGVKDARLLVIEGAAHNAMWDRADVFNREVAAFLRGR